MPSFCLGRGNAYARSEAVAADGLAVNGNVKCIGGCLVYCIDRNIGGNADIAVLIGCNDIAVRIAPILKCHAGVVKKCGSRNSTIDTVAVRCHLNIARPNYLLGDIISEDNIAAVPPTALSP